MAARLRDHPEAVAQTLELAQRLTFDLTSDLGYRYPGAEDATAQGRLAELCGGGCPSATAPARPPARGAARGACSRSSR